jgi:hypothetical protein
MPAYLAHRLQLAGSTLPLFEPAAVEALFQVSVITIFGGRIFRDD